MEIKYALDFLKKHQPMPKDEYIDEDLIKEYDEVRKFFTNHYDERCIPLFLNSFGEGDGLGVYLHIEELLQKYDHNVVVNYLEKGILSDTPSIRYWCTEIAAVIVDKQLVTALKNSLNDENIDIRISSIIALENIKENKVYQILQNRLEIEEDKEVINLIKEVIINF